MNNKKDKLLFEYPFAEFVKHSDAELYGEKIQSSEEKEHIQIQKDRIIKY